MFAISWGQYVWIAIWVNIRAIMGDMPLPATLDAAAAKFPPGCESIGQIDSPTDIAFPGSPKSMPAWLSASMKSSPLPSASAGAANAEATVSNPAAAASRRMVKGWRRKSQTH
jgi:hypothetical protein